MAVTPKGIVTPDASSPYNLITDLNTLASTTDAAIATQKGTASQRTAALAGAPDGTLWQDTDGIKMIWRKDGAAWTPAVWRWGGTTAQMNSFTQAPDRFEWTDTTSGVSYHRVSGSWAPRGVITFTKPAPSSQTVSTTDVALTGLTSNFTTYAPGTYSVNLTVRGYGSTAGQVVSFKIKSGATTLLEFLSNSNSGSGLATAYTQNLRGFLDLPAGAHSLVATAAVATGGGTFTSAPAATFNNTLRVESSI